MADDIICPSCGARVAAPAATADGTAEFAVPGTLSGSGDALDASASGFLSVAPDPLLDLVGRNAPRHDLAPGGFPGDGPTVGMSVHDASPSLSWSGLASSDELRPSAPPSRRSPWPMALLAGYALAATLACAWLLWGGTAQRAAFKEARKAPTQASQASP